MVKKVRGKIPTPKMKGQASRPTSPNVSVKKKKDIPVVPMSRDEELGIIDEMIL